MNRLTTAEAVVASLEAHGIDTVFGVPGESYLAVLDAPRRYDAVLPGPKGNVEAFVYAEHP